MACAAGCIASRTGMNAAASIAWLAAYMPNMSVRRISLCSLRSSTNARGL
jgi:hypothetical protein